MLCDQKKKPATLTKPDPCWCPEDKNDRTKPLKQSSVIELTASLPTTILGSIQFNTGYYPTVNPNPKTTTFTANPTAGSGTTSSSSSSSAALTAAATAPADDGDESTLSPSGQIGAIAGGVAGALLIAILLIGFLCFRRRQRKQQLKREEEARAVDNFMHGEIKSGAASEPDPVNLGIAPGTIPSPSIASSPDTAALSELDSKAARPWSLRSELDNNSSARSSYNTTAGGSGGIGQARSAPSELAAHPIAELPG